MEFENINNSLNQAPAAQSTAKVSVVTLAGVQSNDVAVGTTIADFKVRYGLNGTKIVNEAGDVMNDNDVINSDTQLFVSTPKKNG